MSRFTGCFLHHYLLDGFVYRLWERGRRVSLQRHCGMRSIVCWPVAHQVRANVVVQLNLFIIRWCVLPILRKSLSRSKSDASLSKFTEQTVEYGLKLLLALVFIGFLNIGVVSVATFLGAFGLGFGQGLSSIAQNFVSGVCKFPCPCELIFDALNIVIVTQRIISIGDGVTIGTGKHVHACTLCHIAPRVGTSAFSGEVIKIGLTHTTLKPGEGTHLTIPNSSVVNLGALNYNREMKMRINVEVNIRHNEDIELVRVACANMYRTHARVRTVAANVLPRVHERGARARIATARDSCHQHRCRRVQRVISMLCAQ
jgi:small-conductance mechanosensitive channel